MPELARLAALLGPDLLAPDQGPAIATPTATLLAPTMALAHELGLTVQVQGRGRRLAWGGPVTPELVIRTTRLDRVIEHAPAELVAIAEAGVTVAELDRTLHEAGQWLPLEVAHPETTTLGGLVACAPQALGRASYGQVRDWLIGLEVVDATGTRLHWGGRVVKNVAGYDLLKLYTGSMGTLGAIAQVTFKLRPRPAHTALLRLPWSPELGRACQTRLPEPAVALVALDEAEEALYLGFDGSAAAVEAQVAIARELAATCHLGPGELREGEAAWAQRRALADLLGDRPGEILVARASVLPADLPALLAATRATGTRAHAQLLQGTTYLGLAPHPEPPRIAADWQAAARAVGGHLVLDTRPPDLTMDPWDLPAPTRELMAGVRHALEPTGRLAPGMFDWEGARG